MRIYIQEINTLIKYNLPAKVDGSLLYTFKSSNNSFENSINIDAEDGKWMLKSNGNVNILGNNGIVQDKIELRDYMSIPLSITGVKNYVTMFCLPSVEKSNECYDTEEKTIIKIGKDIDNNIVFNHSLMNNEHAIIFKENDAWFITPANDNINNLIYINSQRIINKIPLNGGDIIFMNGLRIVWMKKSLIIPMTKQLYRVNGLKKIVQTIEEDNSNYKPMTELENNLTLYNENDYFSHIPRIRSVLEKEEVIIDSPPGRQDSESEMPFLLSIGASFTIVGMMSVNAFNIFYSVSSGTRDFIQILPQLVMVSTMLIGAFFIPLFTRKWIRNYNKKREKLRQEKYSSYLDAKEMYIQSIITKQSQIIEDSHKEIDSCIETIKNRTNFLWNRTIKDDDFIELRLGKGDRPSNIFVKTVEERFTLDDDNLLKKVTTLGKKYNKLHNVPITINLKEQVITALILQNTKKTDYINGLVIQLLALHSPLDLKIVIFTDGTKKHRWEHLKYTRHNISDDSTERFFATNQDEAKELSQYLDNIYQDRKNRKKERQEEINDLSKEKLEESEIYNQYYLVITDNYKNIKNLKFINEVVENQYNYGFSFLIIDKDMKNIPNECKKFIVIKDTDGGMFNDKISEDNNIKFQVEYSSNINMRTISKLVANIPVQGTDAASQLPTSLSFLQMYNVGKIEQLNIRNRWKLSDPMSTLSAPIGVHASGELFTLNLHEKSDGPHGLIAGTTGSGKSEFIITYLLSLALNYDPKEVQFILIDYKGGGLAGAFENREQGISIPHLAGTITNLDTAEMNRTLVSIESELKRRQMKFNEVKESTGESTMDIYKYQRLYREGTINEPISHLFIVSDEFAELKAQQPDFMAQLISAARIGRSLGVHLILATQKPSGVVNDQIWSNSKFKVCLKVQTRSDSMEMLKRPEAASIKEAGRFYLQVGYDEYFDIGQSAWTGEKYIPTERIVKKVDNSIVFIDNNGNVIKKSFDPIEKKEQQIDLGDQLTNIVRYLNKISIEDGIKQNKLWLPPLEKNILYDELLKKYAINKELENNILENVIIGEYDAPAEQKQGILTLDLLNNGNLLVYGTAGSGKENLFSSIIADLVKRTSPEELSIYIGDFGAETLKIFNKIPHVGDVFITEEFEKMINFVKMLNKEVETRKKNYSDYGGNFIEYNKYSENKDKFIIVILNNIENFKETYSRNSDLFDTLFREGPKYGIVFLVSTTQQNTIRMRLAQLFNYKICLKMPNTYDYRDVLGSPKTLIPADNFGRGIISIEGESFYEFQTADICNREEKNKYIKDLAVKLTEKYPNIKAKKIPMLPNIVYVEDVLFELKGLDCLPIGIEKNTLEVYVFNFLELKINLIAAKSIKNHIYFIYGLIKQMLELKNVKIHIFDALSIYKGNYNNVDLYVDNLEEGFVKAYNNVSRDKELKEKHVYFILGVSDFKKKVAKYNENFELLFTQTAKCQNNTFIFLDDANNYKTIQVENWYRDNINNTFGIWLGEDIGVQVALGVMSLSREDKENVFPCIGYPIYQGNHMVVKYVVDGVDKKDE